MDTPEAPREKHSVAEAFERVWSQALLAVSTAGWSQEEVKRHAREFTEKLVGHRKDLEHSVEVAVKGALSKLKVPRREDLQEFEARLTKLSERIDALGREK